MGDKLKVKIKRCGMKNQNSSNHCDIEMSPNTGECIDNSPNSGVCIAFN